jgi:hypothetical protein
MKNSAPIDFGFNRLSAGFDEWFSHLNPFYGTQYARPFLIVVVCILAFFLLYWIWYNFLR